LQRMLLNKDNVIDAESQEQWVWLPR
jgi:hypothetical protein